MAPPGFTETNFKAFLNSGQQPFTGFPLAASGLPLADFPIGTGTMCWCWRRR